MSVYELVIGGAGPLIKLYHRIECHGLDNLPPPGDGFIIAANHTNWFGWDGLLISALMPDRKIRWVSWTDPKKHRLWHEQVMAFECIPCNRNIKFPFEEIRDEILGAGGIVGIFPEGTNNTVRHWYRLQPFLPGCAKLAAMSGAHVVPVSVAGLEEASPIFWIGPAEGESPSSLLALPILLPTKITVRFGAPMKIELGEDEINDRAALDAASDTIQSAILELLRLDRPRARAEKNCSFTTSTTSQPQKAGRKPIK